MDDNIRKLLPKDKGDTDNARAIIALEYPAIAPVLPDLMEWLQDFNWPVAKVIAPYLATIGEPLIPEVIRVLHTNDDIWKMWVLSLIVINMPVHIAMRLRNEIERIVANPTVGETEQGVVEVAEEILHKIESNEK
ncbi:MAG: DUF5071 domain-containing protein [Chloroflexota bacterium]